MEEDEDLSQFLDAQQEVAPSNQPPGSSHSSDRSSRGCTPPLAGLSWPSRKRSGKSKSKSRPESPAVNRNDESPSSRSLSKYSDGGSSQSKSRKGKKKLSSGSNVVSPDTSLDLSQGNSSSCAFSGSPSTSSNIVKASSYPSTSSFTSYGSEQRRKKKSWMSSALSPNYRQRCDDLRKNFPGIPSNEVLVGDYSCALQKDILVHGRVYVTTNYLCFYANIFRWETAVIIPWKEVTAMTKEKTALVIPNAVQICTGTDKYFFTSFSARDKTHVVMFKLWQNTLLDNPAQQAEIWSWVTSVYGDQTSRYGSEYNGDESNDAASNCSFDGVDVPTLKRATRLPSNIAEETEELKEKLESPQLINRDSSLTDQSDLSDSAGRLVSPKESNLNSSIVSTTDILTYQKWRQSKDAREILSRNFDSNINDLFTLLFTNSKFFYDFQAERKTFDIVQCPWQHSEESEDKYREVSYTLNLNHPIGPKTSRATEVQTMRHDSVPGHIYNVDVRTSNADIPYSDTFYVATHYCLVAVSEKETLLTVLCDIKYNKTPWGIVKSFIEKNCWAGIQEHFSALSEALDRDIQTVQEEGKDQAAAGGGRKVKTRRQRNQRKLSTSEASNNTGPGHPNLSSPIVQSHYLKKETNPGLSLAETSRTDNGRLLKLLMLMLGFLCLLNMFLVLKIWGIEQKLAQKVIETLPPLQSGRVESPRSVSDWLDILQRQETLHTQELTNWKVAVEATGKLLQQTEASLMAVAESFTSDAGSQLLKVKNLLKIESDTYSKAVPDHVIDNEL